ncbi:MAG: hypothetical protein HOP13_03880 [Alphaproteobacteria bacterium]|nr:hypothetical protein [Alphaproteobacteria bacterium]
MKLHPVTVLAALSFALALPAAAEKWLKIDPNDPFAKEGVYHQFDVDSAMEDSATGYVAATMIYVKPETAKAGVDTSRHLWAFDCTGNNVFYVSVATKAEGKKVTADWQTKPASLAEPVMSGVTNMFGKKLCALKGSWPKGTLPAK